MITPNLSTSSPVHPALERFSPEAAARQQPQELAEEFESLFISLLIKQMRESSTEEGLFPGDSSDSYGGLFDLYMGRHIAQNGGIGLSESLLDSGLSTQD